MSFLIVDSSFRGVYTERSECAPFGMTMVLFFWGYGCIFALRKYTHIPYPNYAVIPSDSEESVTIKLVFRFLVGQ